MSRAKWVILLLQTDETSNAEGKTIVGSGKAARGQNVSPTAREKDRNYSSRAWPGGTSSPTPCSTRCWVIGVMSGNDSKTAS